uniref:SPOROCYTELESS-like EAR-containing protein 1 n=1 Tax=Kalanchoe fedtschenkoi TaxID=63787 RepID=A0A7N0VFW5_KALFE
MSDEERIRNSSSSSSVSFRNGGGGGNGRSSKKPKPKKIPQRGLGVAQLEKIRLEEEVRNEAQTSPPGPAPPVAAPHPATPAASLYSRSLSLPHFAPPARPFPLYNDALYGHHEITYPEGPASNSRSAEYIREMERARLTLNPPSEPGFALRGNQHSSLHSSSTVNAVAGNSSSAVFNFQTEPPSNQSPYGTYRSVQPDEAEKIAGTKRPCPFSLQNPSDPWLHGKFSPLTSHGLGRSTSYGNPGSFAINGNLGHREGLPCSMSMPELRGTNNVRADLAKSDGDFLKLAPPASVSSKAKPALFGLLEHTAVHSQVARAPDSSSVSEPSSSIRHHRDQLLPHPPFHSFFPAPADTLSNRHNGEAEDHVDLNLKL